MKPMYEVEEKTRAEVIADNVGLVHSCAHRFRGRGIEYEDLFQAGCMGLIKAVDAFDPGRGVKLSTYAVPVILGEIKRLFRDGGAVKVSRNLKELSLKYTRVNDEMSKRLGRDPTITEISLEMGVTSEQLVEAVCAMQPTVSLTTDEDETGNRQIDIPVASVEEELGDILSLKEVIATLAQKDRQLIMLRYFCAKTQVETAKQLGMTQVQVSRREKKILIKLRELLIQ